nr:DUF2760 domain-containing protein [Plasticicumulans acidivorans]
MFERFFLAFSAFGRTLFSSRFATGVAGLRQGEAPAPASQPSPAVAEPVPVAPVPAAAPQPVMLREATPDAALQLLGLLQQDGRFIDFLQEDVAAYSDADIGAAARIVHDGCRKVLRNHFELAPVRSENEGSRLTIQAGFDPNALRLTGNVVGSAPFTGTLVHRGWRVTEVRLPKLADGHDVSVVAAAEVEL